MVQCILQSIGSKSAIHSTSSLSGDSPRHGACILMSMMISDVYLLMTAGSPYYCKLSRVHKPLPQILVSECGWFDAEIANGIPIRLLLRCNYLQKAS
jgi:hypothetical protein